MEYGTDNQSTTVYNITKGKTAPFIYVRPRMWLMYMRDLVRIGTTDSYLMLHWLPNTIIPHNGISGIYTQHST